MSVIHTTRGDVSLDSPDIIVEDGFSTQCHHCGAELNLDSDEERCPNECDPLDNSSDIRVMVKAPGRPGEVRVIPRTLESFQSIVGGQVKGFFLATDVIGLDVLGICRDNSEFAAPLERANFMTPDETIAGTAIFMREGSHGQSLSLTPEHVATLRSELQRLSLMVRKPGLAL